MSSSGKIKVAHIVCVLPPYGGGLGTAAEQVALSLDQEEFDVTIFTATNKKQSEIVRKYKVVSLWPLLKFGHGAIVPQLIWHLWHFDIVHFHFPYFGAAFWVYLLKKIRGNKIKLVITYHQDLILSGWKSLYYRLSNIFFLPTLLRTVDKIVVSSEDYIENSFIQGYYFNNLNKFIEIPFAVSDVFSPGSKDNGLLEKYNFIINDQIVLFVGGLDSAHYFKGVNYLIKAINLIPNKRIKALIVGAGNLLPQYEDQVKSLGLSDRIKFAGYVDAEALPKHYNLADLFILPSINRNEAFGIVLIEAMACGLPVIASNLKGVRSVVNPGINGVLAEPQNSRDIADKIEMITSDEAMAKRFSEAAINTVNTKYRLPIIGEKFLKLYRSLLKK